MKCKFISNTSKYNGGGAIYVTGNYFLVNANHSTFIYNSAIRIQDGGAIMLDGECTSCNILRAYSSLTLHTTVELSVLY